MTRDLNAPAPEETPQTIEFEGAIEAAPESADDTSELTFDDAHIRAIQDALWAEDWDMVGSLMEDLGEADIAELLSKVEEDERLQLVSAYGRTFPSNTFLYLSPDLRHDVLEHMGASDVAVIVSDLDSDDALDLLVDLDPVFQKDIIRKLSAKDRATVEEGLNYPEESAGRLMQREYIAVPQFWTAGKTIDYLRAADEEDVPDEFLDVFLVDPKFHVVGELPLHRLLRAKRSEKIESLINDDMIKIPATMDQEEVARLFRRSAISTAPVVDDDGRMLGVITIDDVADVIEEEATEDILRLGGVGQADLTSDIKETAQSRSPWLMVNLVTASLASLVVGLFQDEIGQIVALAVLMPIVAGMGGNAGTQTLTVAVRALATKELSRANAMRMIKKEVIVGLLQGTIFGLIVGGITFVRFHEWGLTLVIGLAMLINMLAAGFTGISVPLILNKLKFDPAVSSGVWLTAVTDMLGFFAFLGLASLILL